MLLIKEKFLLDLFIKQIRQSFCYFQYKIAHDPVSFSSYLLEIWENYNSHLCKSSTKTNLLEMFNLPLY